MSSCESILLATLHRRRGGIAARHTGGHPGFQELIDQHRERMEAQGLDLDQTRFDSAWLTSLKA